MNTRQLARYGEDIAWEYLKKKGYHLVEKNFRHRYGELDLITLTPSKKKLVVVEVKTRYIDARVPPKEAIDSRKKSQLKTTTLYYKKTMEDSVPDSMRIDVIAIEINPDDSIATFEHIKNITL